MGKLLTGLIILLVLFLVPQNCKSAATGKQVVIAYAAMNARVAPLWVARDRGFFAKYGVTADTIFVRGAPTLVAAMQANEIDVGYTGGTAVVGAVANGADLKVLAAFTNRVTYDLMVKPGIKTPEDLRGKKFGIQSIGGTVWMGAILGLEHLGLDPERDKIDCYSGRGRSEHIVASSRERHDRCDRAGRRTEPTFGRAGIPDSRRPE